MELFLDRWTSATICGAAAIGGVHGVLEECLWLSERGGLERIPVLFVEPSSGK